VKPDNERAIPSTGLETLSAFLSPSGEELIRICNGCFRVLHHGGGIRILVPSLEMALEAYLTGDKPWFPDFPTEYGSLGGRFMNFLFCEGQHRLAFDFSFVAETLYCWFCRSAEDGASCESLAS